MMSFAEGAGREDVTGPKTAGEGERSGSNPPLTGTRVLDVSTVYAAPITGMLLGDFGADVIKIEHPQGDPARTHGWNHEGHGLWYKVIARNKRTMTLNFSKPAGQDILRRLISDTDVLIENFRPGVMEKWGLAPAQLQEINPRLIMLRVTGFGLWPLRGAARLRHARRSHEWDCPPDWAGRRAAYAAAIRPGRRRGGDHRRIRRGVRALGP